MTVMAWAVVLDPCLSVHGLSLDPARARYVLRARLDCPDYHLGIHEPRRPIRRLVESNCYSMPLHRHSTRAWARHGGGLVHIDPRNRK